MDKDLFQRVIPWQCLGSVWSRRGSGADIQARDYLLRLSDIRLDENWKILMKDGQGNG